MKHPKPLLSNRLFLASTCPLHANRDVKSGRWKSYFSLIPRFFRFLIILKTRTTPLLLPLVLLLAMQRFLRHFTVMCPREDLCYLTAGIPTKLLIPSNVMTIGRKSNSETR